MKYQDCNSDNDICTSYLDGHLEEGIKIKNLDMLLDIIDDCIELKEEAKKNANNRK